MRLPSSRGVLFGLAALLIMASTSEAGTFLQSFSGNNSMSSDNTAINKTKIQDGTYNFAVIQDWNDGSFAGLVAAFSKGTGSGDLSTATGKYLYLYQLANTGKSTSKAIDSAVVSTILAPVSVFGTFTGFGFTDKQGNVGISNDFGTEQGSIGVFTNFPMTGVDTPGVAKVAGLKAPTSVSFGGGTLQVVYGFAEAGILQGQVGEIFGFVSDIPPIFDNGSIQDGQSTNGSVPVAAPEPASILLMSCAGLLIGGARLRRSWRRKH